MGASKEFPITDHEFIPCNCGDPDCKYCAVCREQKCFHVEKIMSKEINVPEPMVNAAADVLRHELGYPGAADCLEPGWAERIGRGILRVALPFLLDVLHESNPDFNKAILKRGDERYPKDPVQRVAFEFGASFARQYVANILNQPPPPDPIEDLLYDETFKDAWMGVNDAIREAYRRGKDSK